MKKRAFILKILTATAFLCCLLSFRALCAELTDGAVLVSDEGGEAKLTDSNHKTKVTFDEGGDIWVTTEEEMAYLYIIWDTVPGSWECTEGAETYVHGERGFLHEFVRLHRECSQVIIHVPAGIRVSDVRVFSAGEIPGDVQIWNEPYEKADMLLLPVHADDEHLYFGGTMPYYAAELGMRVQVAYMTNHNKEPVREHERLDGLWTVGITAYPIVPQHLDDLRTFALETALELFDKEEIERYYTELIRRFKPYVIVAHDLLGEYGHGAHMLSALVITEIVSKTSDPSFFPQSAQEYGVWDTAKTYLHKYGENSVYMNWDIPLEAFDGKTGFEMAKEGYGCHESQHKYDLAVTRNGVGNCRFFGLFRSTVGADTGKLDFFENIDLTPAPPETEEITEAPPTEAETEEPMQTYEQTEPVTEVQTADTEPVAPLATETQAGAAEQREESSAVIYIVIGVALLAAGGVITAGIACSKRK